MKGQLQNDIIELPRLDMYRFENIFNVYTTSSDPNNTYFFYNTLDTIKLPTDIDPETLNKVTLDRRLAWTILSYQLYSTTYLWWLIFLLNRPKNIFYAEEGKEYIFFKPEYVEPIIKNIKSQINS
jgi:hypothetical protein